MPSAVVGRQWPGAVAAKKTPSSTAVAHLVRDPVALVALGRTPTVAGQRDRRLLDVVARVERADADAQLVAGREGPE